jgi:hypothetical protein
MRSIIALHAGKQLDVAAGFGPDRAPAGVTIPVNGLPGSPRRDY